MKRLTVILSIAIVLIFFFASCEKDVNGIPVKYYENVTGEGYVFVKHDDGTITPCAPYTSIYYPFTHIPLVGISSEEKHINDPENYYHIDRVEVDNNGKYSCRFLEKKRPSVWAWEWKIMSFYTIFFCGSADNNITYTSETIQEAAKKATKKNPQIIPIDTIWGSW